MIYDGHNNNNINTFENGTKFQLSLAVSANRMYPMNYSFIKKHIIKVNNDKTNKVNNNH